MNPKREKFCQEYIMDGNGTRAAIAAGYSPASAFVTASRLLKNANVSKLIERLRSEAVKKSEESAVFSFVEKRKMLKEIATRDKIGVRDVLKAIELDNSMTGDNAPQRMDLTTGDEPIVPVIHFTKAAKDE